MGVRPLAPQGHLTGPTRETRLAEALEGTGTVQAAPTIEAGLAGTVVQVDGAEATCEALGAEAGETIDAIQAGGTVGTGLHQAVIHVGLAARPSEASKAAARQLRGISAIILAKTAIFTWRPGMEQIKHNHN